MLQETVSPGPRESGPARHGGSPRTPVSDFLWRWGVVTLAGAVVLSTADALLLQQHGRHVRIGETQETRLLFDDALLVRTEPRDAQILSFRERARLRVGDGETLVAHQGKWSIVSVDRD